MGDENQEIQDKILRATLDNVAFDGWRWNVVEQAAQDAGFERDMAYAVFPDKMDGVLSHFSAWADRQMIEGLADINPHDLPIRERIKLAVKMRLEVLTPYKEEVRAASIYWLSGVRQLQASKIIWRSADVIWEWAGDTATDYNHYSKRGLLAGVMTSTTMAWLNDKTPDQSATAEFLDRRIDNVLSVGKALGGIKGGLNIILSRVKAPSKTAGEKEEGHV